MQEGFAFFEIIYDKNGKQTDYRLIDSNKAAEAITGIKREESFNKSIFELLPYTAVETADALNEVVSKGEPVNCEIFIKELEKYFSVNIYE